MISWAQGQRGRHYQPDRVRDVASCESVGLCSVECVVCGLCRVSRCAAHARRVSPPDDMGGWGQVRCPHNHAYFAQLGVRSYEVRDARTVPSEPALPLPRSCRNCAAGAAHRCRPHKLTCPRRLRVGGIDSSLCARLGSLPWQECTSQVGGARCAHTCSNPYTHTRALCVARAC